MKQAIGTAVIMGMFALIGMFGNGAPEAYAGTEVELVYYSSTTSRVLVSSGSIVTRIDNWSYGTSGITVPGRTSFQFQNQDATVDVYCSPEPKVSTNTASALLGFRYAAGVFGSEGLPQQIAFYCKAADAAGANGVVLATKQVGKTQR